MACSETTNGTKTTYAIDGNPFIGRTDGNRDIENNLLDTTTAESDGYSCFEYGRQTETFSVSGYVPISDAAYSLLETSARDKLKQPFTINNTGGKLVSYPSVLVNSFGVTDTVDEVCAFTASFTASGKPTISPAV